MSWKKRFWRSELKQFIRDCLKNGDMTITEIKQTLKKTKKINIHNSALSAIIKVTDDVIIKNRIFSEVSKKMINVYSITIKIKNN